MKRSVRTQLAFYGLHLMFWVSYGAVLYSSLSVWIDSPTAVMWAVISDVLTSSALAYFNLFWLLPRLYGNGKYVRYILASILLIVAIVLLRVNFLGMSHRSVVYTYFIRAVPAVGFYLITSVIWFFNNMMAVQRREVDLRNSQLNSELKFLKLQLSPHFLFNTLNNIYSMSYFGDHNTPAAILKLSGMMRHMLYEDQERTVALSKEIGFMENFIELWRLKLDEKPVITFRHSGVREQHRIAHLIFLVFLENAFKHGNTMNGTIDIRLEVSGDDVLHFHLTNEVMQGRNTLEEKSGIGLANVKKRLELIYPGKHSLDLRQQDGHFDVRLDIDLK